MMREITIDIDKNQSSEGFFSKLRSMKPRTGDHLRLIRSDKENIFVAVLALIVIYLFLQNSLRSFGQKVIDDVFGKYKNEEELEAAIEKEYGIKVTVETKEDPDREDWMRFSAAQFESGFSDPGDDYSDVQVKEPNPDYIPWKKGTS